MHSSETIVTISSKLAQSQPMSTIPTQVLGIPTGSPNASPCSIWLFVSWMKENFPTASLIQLPATLSLCKIFLKASSKSSSTLILWAAHLKWMESKTRVKKWIYFGKMGEIHNKKTEIIGFSFFPHGKSGKWFKKIMNCKTSLNLRILYDKHC